MVFQNPDNQIVGATVEEDAAFGPECRGLEPAEIRRRVTGSLEAMALAGKRAAAAGPSPVCRRAWRSTNLRRCSIRGHGAS